MSTCSVIACFAAVSRANATSDSPGMSKVKACKSGWWAAASAATVVESIPPDRKVPTGTSASSCSSTAASSAPRNHRAASSSEIPSITSGGVHQRSIRGALPSEQRRREACGIDSISLQMDCPDGTYPCRSISATILGSGVIPPNPAARKACDSEANAKSPSLVVAKYKGRSPKRSRASRRDCERSSQIANEKVPGR